jgi:rhodanese-related sulfurtransferase
MEEVTPAELQDMQANDDPVIIDVLPNKYFRKRHIPGAINIEMGDIELVSEFVDEDRAIVVYCMDEQCGLSPQAAEKLESLGYTSVFDLPSGIDGWEDAGMRTATST